ncbi:MAG: hypothetical protein JWL97_22 [Gemmatimonadales bacterium]|nr:hypothetical protein [Gemmatimonadales bacterium]
MPLIFQKGASSQRSQTLVIGSGLNLDQTPEGLAQLSAGGSSSSGEAVVQPSGSDDTAAIQSAISGNARVQLAPGIFHTSGIVDMAAGVSLRGAGTDKTTVVKGNFNGPAFRLGDQVQLASIENLRITGPGKTVASGNKAIQAARNAPPQGLALARRLSFRNLYITDIGEQGMYFDGCTEVEIDNVILENIGFNPIYFSGGGSARISTVRAFSCGPIYVRFTSGVALIACEVESGFGSFRLNTATDVALIACVSKKCEEVPLKISAGSNIVVDAFGSDNTGTSYFVDQPHLLVDTAATGVVIDSFRRVNTDKPGTLTSEANVTGAGGPVLVGYHNFTAGKIVSGGKFADISSTPRA